MPIRLQRQGLGLVKHCWPPDTRSSSMRQHCTFVDSRVITSIVTQPCYNWSIRSMNNWLSRIRSEPVSTPAIPNSLDASWLQTPSTPRSAPKPRDPNAPDYRYQVNQKCIYERRLPGGSYITAHVQRLQSGFYDSPVIHEDCIDNVRFLAINFVFHPSRSTFRFTSAEISIALRHTGENTKNPFQIVTGLAPRSSSHDHGTQTETVNHALIRSKDCLHFAGFKPSRPKFLCHAPHLLYGAISPENLNWNFNLAGSLGVSQGPASASLKPSYGVGSSYKVYDMMKIQGSVRRLRSWAGHDYDIEDGELVWTLEENRLQKSGLPREFTFVMLLTKGSGTFEESGDVRLEVDVRPKVMGRLGTNYPSIITNLHQYQPFNRGILDLDEQIGQVFEPQVKGRGFNFANVTSSFDAFVWLPGNAYSTSEPSFPSTNGYAQQQIQGLAQLQGQQKQSQQVAQQTQRQNPKRQPAIPTGETTLNLRVFLETSQGSPIPFANQTQQPLPYLNLRGPQHPPRTQSPLPHSDAGSRSSAKRTVTIGSSKSIRKQRSRSELGKEYNSSPIEQREKPEPQLMHDRVTLRQGNGDGPQRPFSYPERVDVHHDQGTQMSPNVYRKAGKPNIAPTVSSLPNEVGLVAVTPHQRPDHTTPPSQRMQPSYFLDDARTSEKTPTPLLRSCSHSDHATKNANGAAKRVSVTYDNPPQWPASPLQEDATDAAQNNAAELYAKTAAQRASSFRVRDSPDSPSLPASEYRSQTIRYSQALRPRSNRSTAKHWRQSQYLANGEDTRITPAIDIPARRQSRRQPLS